MIWSQQLARFARLKCIVYGTEDESFFNEAGDTETEEKRVKGWSGYPQNTHPTLQEMTFKYAGVITNTEPCAIKTMWQLEQRWVRTKVEVIRGQLQSTETIYSCLD